MRVRAIFMTGCAAPLAALSACGGSGGTVNSTPAPPPAPAPAPAPAPTPTPAGFDTAEYRQSNAAVQAQALVAYQAGASGAGVVAGVIDSGVAASNPEFAGRISPLSADLAGSRGIEDQGGHGTAVSDVLLGARDDNGIHGIAPSATLLVLRTDTPGSCTGTGGGDGCTHNDNAIASGLDLAVSAHARVVNISLGGEPANGTLRAAIDRATSAGVIIVISAGNEFATDPVAGANPDPLAQIAIDPVAHGLVLIAGAVDGAHAIASFSNRAGNSASVFIDALGVRVRSIDQTGATFLFSGTSFSAPAVAGAVALVAQAFPTLTPAQIVDLLLRTATDLGDPGTDAVYGRGELNLARAFAPQGQTSLSGSTVPVSLTGNATLSAPMGDAARSGIAATIRDSYGRDFAVDLAPTIAHSPRATRLAPGLALDMRSAATQAGAATLALSVAGDAPRRMLLTRDQAESARVLAGSVAMRLGPATQVILGLGQSADAGGAREPAFLVADRAGGIERAPKAAFALRQHVGGIGLSIAAENGDLRLWERSELGPRGDAWRRRGYDSLSVGVDASAGPVEGAVRVMQLSEADSVLGADFGPALGGGGATSLFADARLSIVPASGWRLGAAWRQGWTRVAASSVRAPSTLRTQAIAFDATRDGIFGGDLSLRWSRPLRVTGGGLRLTGFGSLLDLAPEGREQDVEAVYARAFGPGTLTFNSYWRRQPGNFRAASDDLGLALRYGFEF